MIKLMLALRNFANDLTSNSYYKKCALYTKITLLNENTGLGGPKCLLICGQSRILITSSMSGSFGSNAIIKCSTPAQRAGNIQSTSR